MTMLETLRMLKNNDGLTLRKGKAVTYKTGYQVATEGVECKTAEEAAAAIASYEGTCGVWLSEGIFYIDKSHRERSLRKALEVGRAHNQISILSWANMGLIYC